MSFAFDVYYRSPENLTREKALVEMVSGFGGKLHFRELTGPTNETICLTFEFEQREAANRAVQELQLQKEHVEVPYDY